MIQAIGTITTLELVNALFPFVLLLLLVVAFGVSAVRVRRLRRLVQARLPDRWQQDLAQLSFGQFASWVRNGGLDKAPDADIVRLARSIRRTDRICIMIIVVTIGLFFSRKWILGASP